MADIQWIDNMRKIMKQSEEASGPCDVCCGTVVSAQPLKVEIDQKLVLSESQLLLAASLKDHSILMEIPGLGEVTALVRSGLKPGEQVMLVRRRGGQQYAVVDRIA